MTKKIGLYGNDQGANNVLDAVDKTAMADADLKVLRVPGLNIVVPSSLRAQVSLCDAIVCGISSGDTAGIEAGIVRELLQVRPQLSGKVLFIEDFPGSSGYKNRDLIAIGKQVHLGSIMPLPQNAPERAVYAGVHTLGYPDHWLPAMQNIQHGAALRRDGKVMKRLRGVDEPVGKDEVVIYFTGFKRPWDEIATLTMLFTVNAIDGRPVLVHFRAHPGEKNRPELAEGIKQRDTLLDGRWEIASPEIVDAGKFTDSRLIGVADITVAHPGATSNFHVAALRKPMICPMEYVSPADQASSSYDYALTGRNTQLVDKLHELPWAITQLARSDSVESIELRHKQEMHALPFDSNAEPTYGKNAVNVIKKLLEQ